MSYGRHDLSDVLMQSYFEKNDVFRTTEEMELFNYYRAYRANVKIKVLGLRAMNDDSLRTNRTCILLNISEKPLIILQLNV